MKQMGFVDDDGGQSCRWVAIRHGLSKKGNDHVHIAANLVREDGTPANVHNDYKRAQRVASGLEKEYGLDVLESRTRDERTLSGNKPAELERARREGESYTQRDELRRRLRTVAANAASEHDFIIAAKRARVLVRPRYEKGNRERVVGYSAALIPSSQHGDKPIWYAPSKLDRSLGLGSLRSMWKESDETERSTVDTWKGATRALRSQQFGIPAKVQNVQPSSVLYARLASHDGGGSFDADAAAADLAGAFAHASMNIEKGKPGALASASDTFARGAQGKHAVAAPRRTSHAAYQARLVVRASSKDSRTGWIAVLRQMTRLSKRIADAQEARGARVRAAEMRVSAQTGLAALQSRIGAGTGERPAHLRSVATQRRGNEMGK